ncbi:MAG: branched-chain amino acid ABC transporter permease [Gammaproteobacteria bacterium]|nr:branched-chain amino acid ABC transporter permease [Gammaproteobacteria bacterium]
MALQPSGVFFENYSHDKALIKTKYQWLSLAIFGIFLLLVPFLFGPRVIAVANIMIIMAVVAVGLQITTGYAGQINLGQAAFMGVGAYTAGLVAIQFSLPFWLSIPLGGVAAAAFGYIFGLSAVRIKGFYLALTTIAAQFIFHFAILNLPTSWFGGSNGLTLDPASLFGFEFKTDSSFYYLALLICAIMVIGAFGIVRSRYGRAFVAVRDDDVASSMMGINVVATKASAFLVGAFFAGIGGGLWAYYVRFVSVDQFTLFNSVWFVAMIIVGGSGSIVGALIGVFLIRSINELVTSIGPVVSEAFPFIGGDIVFAAMNIILGGVICLFVIYEPKGLMYRWNIMKTSYRIWPFPH